MSAFDTPTVGAGLETVTWSHPADSISEETSNAVNCVALKNVVLRSLPLKFTVAPSMKPVPFTVIVVNPEPPAAVDEGESVVIAGAGLTIDCVIAGDIDPEKLTSPLYAAVIRWGPNTSELVV